MNEAIEFGRTRHVIMRQSLALVVLFALAVPAASEAQMTYRLKGTVKDNDGKPVSGARVRAEALIGFRGEQFVGLAGTQH
jgi:hypothetical protein